MDPDFRRVASKLPKPVNSLELDGEYSEAWSIVEGLFAFPAILLAYDLRLFAALENGPLSLAQLSEKLAIPSRTVRTLASVCAAHGFLAYDCGRCSLSESARSYLIDGGPRSLCSYLSLIAENSQALSLDVMKGALLEGRSVLQGVKQRGNGRDDDSPEVVHRFILAMHSASAPPCCGLAGLCRSVGVHVDVGCGWRIWCA